MTDTFGSTIDRFAPNRLEVSHSERSWEKRDISGLSANVDYDFDNGYSFKSISAWRDIQNIYHNDTDGSAIDVVYVEYTDQYEQLTQEFQLISPDHEKLKYVVGLYYYKQDSTTSRDAVTGNAGWLFGIAPGAVTLNQGTVETDSLAVYMDGSYQVNDRWRLGFGFRYTDETKDTVWHLDGSQTGVFGIGVTPPGGYIDTHADDHFSPALSINYAISDAANIYARYSTGFKSGGFNLDYVTQSDLENGITFDKETVDSFELGLKAGFLDNRLAVNIAAFIANYDDYQVNQFFDLGFDAESGTQLTAIRITNAARVETSGLELEATYVVTDRLTLRGALGLLDASFKDFPGGTSIAVSDPGVPGGIVREPVNAAGNRLPLAAELTATFGAVYLAPIEAWGVNFMARLDVLYTGDYYTGVENEKTRNLTGTHPLTFAFDIASFGIPHQVPYGYVDAFTTLNGRIGLLSADGAWEVYLWGRNLTDESNPIAHSRDFFGTLLALPLMPRTYGIEASYHWH